jgi:hypothetical protein
MLEGAADAGFGTASTARESAGMAKSVSVSSEA